MTNAGQHTMGKTRPPRKRNRTGIVGLAMAFGALLAIRAYAGLTPVPEDEYSIGQLLWLAEQDVIALRLTTPPGNNAVERFRSVLRLDADNTDALAGLRRVVERYVALADRAIADRRLGRAARYLSRAESVIPATNAVGAAEQRLATARIAAEAARSSALNDAVEQNDETQQTEMARPTTAQEVAKEAKNIEQTEPAQPTEPNTTLASSQPVPAGSERQIDLKRRPYRFALFPHASIVPCFYAVARQIEDAAEKRINEFGNAKLEYSYLDTRRSWSLLPDSVDIWSENYARREPLIPSVVSAGKRLDVDGVLMAWFFCRDRENFSDTQYRVELHLIDVDTQKSYFAKEELLHVDRAATRVFDGFFNARQ